MYKSLIKYKQIPVTIKPFLKRDGTGQKIFSDSIETTCYAASVITLVTTLAGADVTSTTQLYLLGTEIIKTTDDIIFEGEVRPIKSIGTFYEGNTGKADIKVVYL